MDQLCFFSTYNFWALLFFLGFRKLQSCFFQLIGTAADLEPTDLDDVLEMGLRNPQVQRYEADCDELHDDMADLGVQLRKLLFGSNYNLVARFFKLTEIEGK